jgi:hypothetical protein
MSANPVSDSSHGAAGLEVLRAVAAARRRLRTVAILQHAAVAGPAGATAGAALALAGLVPAWTAGGLGLLGAVGATVWAAVHTPTSGAVARQLDAQLGLRDRVAAAVQLQQSGGPIAALVARDAAARLAPVRMAAVFPLSIGRTQAVAAAIAVASVAWLLSIDPGARRPTTPATTAAAGSTNAEAGTPARDGARADARREADSNARAEARDRSVNAPERPRDPRATATHGTAAQDASAPAPSRGIAPTTGAVREARDTSQPADGRRDGTGSPAATSTPGQNARGGAGASARGGLTAGAGGVASGNARAGETGSAAPVATAPGSYRTARTGAEAALARDVIPPDYREHVRAYFRALGQGGTR